MLTAGHRSICIPAHTLFLWGGAGGILALAADLLITEERFPVIWQRNVALLFLLSVVLSGVALADFGFTRQRLQARDESLSFVHAQITKVWWLLIGMGVLFTFATGVYGGSYMVFGVWLVLIGLGLYVHGLFSDQILEWVGILIILLGIGSMLPQLGYLPAKWLTASVLGLGFPALVLMLGRGTQWPLAKKLNALGLWLLWVAIPPALGYYTCERIVEPVGPVISLSAFGRQSPAPAEQIIQIPSGTISPLKIRMQSNLLHTDEQSELPMRLTQPLQISMINGVPDGRFRAGDGEWKRGRFDIMVSVEKMAVDIQPGKAPALVIDMQLQSGK